MIVGYAAPKAGIKPSALRLLSDGEAVCVARASRYSADAAAAGLRVGWCGFELPGLAKALAIGSAVSIVCAATGAELEQLSLSPEIFAHQGARTSLTAEQVFLSGSAGERCADLYEVAPFAIDHRNRHGCHSFIEATYQMVLDRMPDPKARKLLAETVETDEGLVKFLSGLIDSEEHTALPLRLFPGPFHPSFRYDRSLIG